MTAVTVNTIEVPFSKSHRWPTNGKCRTPSTVYTYTGLSFAGDKLTFTGVTPSPAGETVPGEIYYTTDTFGIAQLAYNHCHFGDMSHGSNRYCVDNYFGANAMADQSCATEISGRGVRQPVFVNCTWHATEDRGIHIHDCRHHQFFGGHVEGRAAVNQSGAALPRGTRIIHLAANAVQQSAPYVYRAARQGIFTMMSIGDTADIGPSGKRDTEITTKYGATDGSGLFVAQDSAVYFWWKDTDKPNIFLEGVQIRGQAPRVLFDDRDDGRQWEVGIGVSGAFIARNVNDNRIPFNIGNTAPDGAVVVGGSFMDIRALAAGLLAGRIGIADGVASPGTIAGVAQIYVDSADGDLKIKFADGVVKTIVVDT